MPKDKMGKAFKVGDYYVQAQRKGCTSKLAIGRVVGIDDDLGVKARGAEERWTGEGEMVGLNSRTHYIQKPDLCCIVPSILVPEKYRAVLKDLV